MMKCNVSELPLGQKGQYFAQRSSDRIFHSCRRGDNGSPLQYGMMKLVGKSLTKVKMISETATQYVSCYIVIALAVAFHNLVIYYRVIGCG